MDLKRLLAPLDAERDAIRRLGEYTTPAELADAIRSVAAAVDRVLRLLLREDRGASDTARMAALSETQAPREVVQALRRADTITMELAAGAEQLREAAARADSGVVNAADADMAQDVVRRLMDGVAAAAEPFAPNTGRAERAAPPAPVGRRRGRSLLVGAVFVVAGGSFAWIALRGSGPTGQAGVEAFAADRMLDAEAIFRSRVEDGTGNATDWLYLGRIYRRTGRFEEAAAALRTAVDAEPRDADVRRELGWLFMDLDRPVPASEQFRLAIESDPDEPLTWVGLISALRTAGDPSAEEWHARAPAEARVLLESAASGRTARQ